MDNNGSRDYFSNSFMIVIGAIIGVLAYSITQHTSEWFILPIVALNVVIIVYCYQAIKKSYVNALRSNLREVVENVRNITEGGEFSKPEKGFSSKEITELYDTIESLHNSLVSQNHSKDYVLNIINSIALNIELSELLEDMLPKIIAGTKSNWGAFYLYNPQSEKMELESSIGFTKNIYQQFDIELGEGFVGKSAQTDEITVFNDIPDDTVYISKTFLGKIKPRSIMTVPIRSESETIAVLLLAGLYDYGEEQLEIIKLIRYYMASAVANGLTYERTKRLKNELTFQNQLIQNMNEELESKVETRTTFWSNIINSIVDYAIVALDVDGNILMWNKGAELLRGYDEEEVIGRHVSETYLDSDRNDALERLKAAKRDGKYEDYSWITSKDGSVINAHRIVAAVYDAQGELTGYTTITRDMTTYKQLEDKATYFSYLCDLLLSGEQKGLLLLNDAGFILNASPKAADICGRSLSELNGSPFEDALETNVVFRDRLYKCLSDLTSETWNDRLNNEGREVSLSLTGVSVPGSAEKIAILYIDNADNTAANSENA